MHCEYTDLYGYLIPMKWILPMAFVVLWSSGYVGATLAAQAAPAETTLLWRFVTAGAVLAVVVTVLGRRYSPAFVRREAVLGLLGQCGYLLGVFVAADLGAPTGTTALIASLQPALVAVILATLGERGGRRQAGGLVLGLLGVMIVVGGAGGGSVASLLAVSLGTVSLTAATVVADRWRGVPGHDLLDSLAVQSVVAAGFFLLLATARGVAAPPASTDFWLAIAWIAVLSFAGGYGCYLLVLRNSGPMVVSAWLYLTPGTTAVWAAVMFGEALGAQTLLGLAVAAVGVATVLPRSRDRVVRARNRPTIVPPPRDRVLRATARGEERATATSAQPRRAAPDSSLEGCTL